MITYIFSGFNPKEHFGKEVSKFFKEDINNLGGKIASIGQTTTDSTKISKIGEIFHSKPKEILAMFNSFKKQYDNYKKAGNVKSFLMNVIKTSDAEGVANLFKIDDYNVSGYISNYVKELQGEYYTQRWYICSRKSGNQVLVDYVPKPGKPTTPSADMNWFEGWEEWVEYSYKENGKDPAGHLPSMKHSYC